MVQSVHEKKAKLYQLNCYYNPQFMRSSSLVFSDSRMCKTYMFKSDEKLWSV